LFILSVRPTSVSETLTVQYGSGLPIIETPFGRPVALRMDTSRPIAAAPSWLL